MKRFHGFTDADIKLTKARRNFQQGDDREKEWGALDDEFRLSGSDQSGDEGEAMPKKSKLENEIFYAKNLLAECGTLLSQNPMLSLYHFSISLHCYTGW